MRATTAQLYPGGNTFEFVIPPKSIRFLIGGERVTCHWSKLNDRLGRTKLNDALGRTKLDDALGKQQLELWTGT